jgi:hypothetical protein
VAVKISGPRAAHQKPAGDLLDKKARNEMLYNRALPHSSALGNAARKIDQQWGDDNIMSGVVSTFAGHVAKGASDAQLKVLAADLLADALKATDELKTRGALKLSIGSTSQQSVSRAAHTVAVEGFVYSDNAENVGGVFKDLKEVIARLGPAKEIRAVHAHGVVDHPDQGKVPVNVFLFANTRTGDVAAFYSRQGSA